MAALQHLAFGATLRIPPLLLVQHVLTLTAQADWPVRRAAMEALLRRCAFALRDRLRIAARPTRQAPFGAYSTRRVRGSQRPYSTSLQSLSPLRGSCDCPDYLRSSLGLCKHLLVVLDDLAARPRRWQRALAAPTTADGPELTWDPVRPLTGRGDWLGRVWWHGFDPQHAVRHADLARARRWFRGGTNGDLQAEAPGEDRPQARTAMIEDLLRASEPPRHGGTRRQRAKGGRARLTAEPALHALLAAERKHLARITADRAERKRLERSLRSLRRPLYPYQQEGVRRFLDTGRLLLADDMGLGKTVQATAACHVLWHAGRVRRGLLIVPASLKSQWQREWRLFSDAPIDVVDGGPQQRHAFYRRRRLGFLLVNYEQVLRDLPAMQAWAPDLIVLDEAQRIKNWATRTAGCVKQLQPAYRLVLTGTPMENRLEELASIVEWVDDHALEPKWRLVPWHSMWSDGASETAGARNLDTLRVRLAPCMLRRVRREILTQLPPRTDSVIPVDLTSEQRDEHDALNQPIAQLAAIARKRPLTQAQFLRLMTLLTTQRMIANGLGQIRFAQIWPQISAAPRPEPQLLQSLHSPKLSELREIIAQVAIQQQRKVVVFSQWRRMLALAHWAVGDVLAEGGLRAAFFTGRENQRQRTRNIVEFHDDPRVRVLFATDAGGVGLNLQRAASCCVNIELPWNPAVLEQRIGRIFRMGQKRPIDVYNLVAQDCIESRIAALVGDKRALFTGLFDGRSDEIRFERSGSFLANVGRLVEAGPGATDGAGDGAGGGAVGQAAAATQRVARERAVERRVAAGHGDGAAGRRAAAAAEELAAESESVVDAAVEREIEALVAAADESRGADEILPAEGLVGAAKRVVAAPATADPIAASGPIQEDPGAAADGSRVDGAAAIAEAAARAVSAADVRRLFTQLEIRPTSQGGLRIEANAEAAATLVALFEGLAGLLRGTQESTRVRRA